MKSPSVPPHLVRSRGAFSARPRFHHSAGAYYGVAQNPPLAWAPIAGSEADAHPALGAGLPPFADAEATDARSAL